MPSQYFGPDITVFGNAKISTAEARSGNSSVYFDGNRGGLILNNSILNLGDANFVLSFWVKMLRLDSYILRSEYDSLYDIVMEAQPVE